MTKIAVYAGGDLDLLKTDAELFVGVDAGSLFLIDHRLPLDVAIGDFDSVDAEGLALIEQEARDLVRLPDEKNDTDLEFALKYLFGKYPDAQITVVGALGGRIDHALSNVFLASEPGITPFMEQLQLVNEHNVIRYLPAGTHTVQPVAGMTYVSFLPSDGSKLTITDAKYPLNEDNYFFKKCYTSNEFVSEAMQVSLDTGYVVVIYSKDGN